MENIDQMVELILNFLPIIIIIAIIGSVAHSVMNFGSYGGSSTTTEGPVDDIDTYDAEKRMRLEAEREIKMRFARGEMSKEEYTEMMSRL